MHKKHFLASFGAMVFTGSVAVAADLSPPPPPFLPPPFTWDGTYVGGQIGYAWGADHFYFSGFDPVSRIFANSIINNNPNNGVIGGAHLGSQIQFNQVVLGIEGLVDGTNLRSNGIATVPLVFGSSTLSSYTSAPIQGSIRGKIGIAWDRLLIYGTGGVAFGGFSNDFSLVAPVVPSRRAPIFATANTSTTRAGWTAGGGIQYAAATNWWFFVEYRFTDFGTLNHSLLANELPAGAFFNGNRRLQENQVQGGFSYRFNLLPPPPPVIAKY